MPHPAAIDCYQLSEPIRTVIGNESKLTAAEWPGQPKLYGKTSQPAG